MSCKTLLFRDDLNWKDFAELAVNNFSNKNDVNTLIYASSDGSEAYSTIMSFIEASKSNSTENKFFPIKAFDIDMESIKAAQSGLINVDTTEQFLAKYLYKIDLNNYLEKSDKQLIIPNNNMQSYLTTMVVKDVLKNNVEFNYGNMFDNIQNLKDSSNTILMCRNVLAYYDKAKINNFIKSVSDILKNGSLFIIGDYDLGSCKGIKPFIEKQGFKEVIHNVYKKL